MIRGIPRIEDAQYDLTDAIGKGFVALELNWTPGEVWLPRPSEDGRQAIQWIPQRLFRIENMGARAGQLHYLKDGIPEPLTPGRWLIHEHRAKSGYIEASALFRVLAWTYAYKAYNMRDMQKFLELYGLPLRLGKYPAGLADKDRDTLLRAVKSIGHDGAGVIPATMQIEFIQAQKAGTVTDFLTTIEYWERKQSVAILGGTLTSQADGESSTNALGNVHNLVRREIMLHDVRQIEPTLSEQLVRPIAVINGLFATDRCPSFAYLTEETVDQEKMVKVLKEAVSIGMRIDLDWAHEAMQIPVAAEDAETLSLGLADGNAAYGGAWDTLRRAVSPPFPTRRAGGLRDAALARQAGSEDAVTIAADRLIVDTAPALEGWLETIEAMLEAASSLEEFREMLLAAWPELSTDKLEEAMSEAFTAMDLRGQAEVADEAGIETAEGA